MACRCQEYQAGTGYDIVIDHIERSPLVGTHYTFFQFQVIIVALQLQHGVFALFPQETGHLSVASQRGGIATLGEYALCLFEVLVQLLIVLLPLVGLHTAVGSQYGQVGTDNL